jgi:MFS family permease
MTTAAERAIPDVRAVQRRTLAVLIVAQVIGTVGVGVAPSIGILLASEVTGDEAMAGLARTASTLGAALFGLPLGTLAAQRGRRVALTLGWLFAAAGSALLVAAAQWSLVVPLFIGLLLIGAGSAVALQARFAATDLAEPHHKARSLALVVWVGTLGSVLGPNLGLPGEIVGAATGLFASAFLIATVCLALAGVVVFVWLRPDPLLLLEQTPPAADRSGGGTTRGATPSSGRRPGRIRLVLAELRTNRRARTATITILTAQAVMVAVMTMTPVHLAHHGDSVNVIGLTISLHVVGMFALAPVVGALTDRFGHRATITIGIAIFVVSLVIGALWPDDTRWIIASLILLGVGWSFMNVAGSALFSTSVSDQMRAASQGGVDALSNLFGAAAALAAGPIMVATNFSVLSVLSMIVLVPVAVLMLAREV